MSSRYSRFYDGLTSLINALANRRNKAAASTITTSRTSNTELRAIYKTGLASKIIRLKSGYALDDTIQFESKEQQRFYEERLETAVRLAVKYAMGFGRGIIVIQEPFADLQKPLFASTDISRARLRNFSGDMVTASQVNRDLDKPRYFKPIFYSVRGQQIHHSRVIDFTYVDVPELDQPTYQYGGISEFELIYEQLVNDGVVQRAGPAMLDKNSSLFIKVKGFKQQLAAKKEGELLEFFSKMEDARGIFGASIIDMEDDVEAINQTLTNLADADMTTLRRLAMVTGISLTELVGESAAGLNSSGDNEQEATYKMAKTLQRDIILRPVNELMAKYKKGRVSFKQNQEPTPKQQLEFDGVALDNAIKLQALGEDHEAYLEDKGVIKSVDDFSRFFPDPEKKMLPDGEAQEGAEVPQLPGVDSVDPGSALNGAQVTALQGVIAQVATGEIKKPTAIKIIKTAFPLTEAEAKDLLAEVEEPQPTLPGESDAAPPDNTN